MKDSNADYDSPPSRILWVSNAGSRGGSSSRAVLNPGHEPRSTVILKLEPIRLGRPPPAPPPPPPPKTRRGGGGGRREGASCQMVGGGEAGISLYVFVARQHTKYTKGPNPNLIWQAKVLGDPTLARGARPRPCAPRGVRIPSTYAYGVLGAFKPCNFRKNK